MSECIDSIIRHEKFWNKWKENKCPNFERPSSELCRVKKRISNPKEKLIGNGGMLMQAEKGKINDHRNGRAILDYLARPKESIDAEGHSVNIKQSTVPTLGDYMYAFLCDQDPDQDIDEEYKKKND